MGKSGSEGGKRVEEGKRKEIKYRTGWHTVKTKWEGKTKKGKGYEGKGNGWNGK